MNPGTGSERDPSLLKTERTQVLLTVVRLHANDTNLARFGSSPHFSLSLSPLQHYLILSLLLFIYFPSILKWFIFSVTSRQLLINYISQLCGSWPWRWAPTTAARDKPFGFQLLLSFNTRQKTKNKLNLKGSLTAQCLSHVSLSSVTFWGSSAAASSTWGSTSYLVQVKVEHLHSKISSSGSLRGTAAAQQNRDCLPSWLRNVSTSSPVTSGQTVHTP